MPNRMGVRPFALYRRPLGIRYLNRDVAAGNLRLRISTGEARYDGWVDPEPESERGVAPHNAGAPGGSAVPADQVRSQARRAGTARVHRRQFIALAATGGIAAAGAVALALSEDNKGPGLPATARTTTPAKAKNPRPPRHRSPIPSSPTGSPSRSIRPSWPRTPRSDMPGG